MHGQRGTTLAVHLEKGNCEPPRLPGLDNTMMIATHASITLAAGHGPRRPGPQPRRMLCVAAVDSREQGAQQQKEDTAPSSRRQLGLRLLSAAAALPRAPPSEAAAAGAASLTPYQRGLALEYGLTQDGRIRSCPSDANPNCVSTASTNTVRCFAVGAAHRPPLCSCFGWAVQGRLHMLHNLATAALQTYAPAWEAPQGSLAEAVQQFQAALAAVVPEVRLVESASSAGSEYRRFAVQDPLFDRDDIE